MPKASTIRGVERGLQVLKLLQAGPPATLQDVHAATALPKPSLLRILATLERAGLVHRRIDDGRYRPSAKQAEVALRPHPFDRLAEAATPVLDRLCRKIVWPSDLAVAAGDHMEIRETSRTLSPFVFNSARIGYRINWLLTAMGRAYLAFCSEEERLRIIEALRYTKNPQDRLASQPRRLAVILAETAKRGYGLRDPTWDGGFYDSEFDRSAGRDSGSAGAGSARTRQHQHPLGAPRHDCRGDGGAPSRRSAKRRGRDRRGTGIAHATTEASTPPNRQWRRCAADRRAGLKAKSGRACGLQFSLPLLSPSNLRPVLHAPRKSFASVASHPAPWPSVG